MHVQGPHYCRNLTQAPSCPLSRAARVYSPTFTHPSRLPPLHIPPTGPPPSLRGTAMSSSDASSWAIKHNATEHHKPTPEEAVERLSHYHPAHRHFHRAKSMVRRSGRIMIAGCGFLADSYGTGLFYRILKRLFPCQSSFLGATTAPHASLLSSVRRCQGPTRAGSNDSALLSFRSLPPHTLFHICTT